VPWVDTDLLIILANKFLANKSDGTGKRGFVGRSFSAAYAAKNGGPT
jgi:hypothetical protein